MPQCVVLSSGQLVESAADPCTGFVVLTSAEYGALAANPFRLSPEDGAQLGFAVAGVWAVAWGCRQLMDLLRSRFATDE